MRLQCIGQEFALNEARFFIVKLLDLQRFKSFTLAYRPAGSLPPEEWAGKPGRQGVENIFPAINFTLHSNVCSLKGFGDLFTELLIPGWGLNVRGSGCLVA
jgi:hypothetical protein